MFQNIYQGEGYASAYAGLDWGLTYHLIARDLPGILRAHVQGTRALDFGCGTGRSTRLLRSLGFDAVGADIAWEMVRRAREIDPEGRYELLDERGLNQFEPLSFDLVLAAFPFDNTPAKDKPRLFESLARLLSPTGCLVNIVSSAELYTREWASFSTAAYPENRDAKDGDIVRIVTTSFANATPCDDVLCTDDAYRRIYGQAGLEVAGEYRPLAKGDEPIQWGAETTIAPWVIWVLKPARRD